MATSLAAQLQKLATPQTSSLFDSKKRKSILFDAKEAANKDREVIYDIGASGLEELIEMNPSFKQFQNTLFDKSSIELERSVEKNDINERLNDNIKKFFMYLSPYFMLQPAHKCIEWLIRRFHIHDYNRKEFVLLILPYHETRVFVRCIQVLSIGNENDEFYWLKGVQKSGVTLSKQAIYNHAAGTPSFIRSIGSYAYDATKELDVKAGSLQTLYAFYCTTVIGALEYATNVSENHVVAIIKALGRGLTSSSIDFVASNYMITAQLVTKSKLSNKILEYLLLKICNLTHPTLTIDAIMLIILIFQTQHEQYSKLSDNVLEKVFSSKWIPSALGQIKTQGINIIPFYMPVLKKCLQKVQEKDSKYSTSRAFCESLLLEVTLSESEADQIIQCVLDTYFHKDSKPKEENALHANNHDIISLDSDEEDAELQNIDEIVTKWYSTFLKQLEIQYPESFDRTVKNIMKGNAEFSQTKMNALKNVLGFLLQVSYSDKEKEIFEDMYHHDYIRRSHAVEYLVSNFASLNLKTESNEFVKESLAERLSDDHPEVVEKLLKLDASKMVGLIGQELLIQKLSKILLKCYKKGPSWRVITKLAINLLTKKIVWGSTDTNKVFLTLLPFMFPTTSKGIEAVKEILKSEFGKENAFFAACRATINDDASYVEISKSVTKALSAQKILPDCESLIKTTENFPLKPTIHSVRIYFNILLLSKALPKKCSPEMSQKIIELTTKMLNVRKLNFVMSPELDQLRNNKLPINVCMMSLESIIDCTNFERENVNGISVQSDALKLKLKLFEIIVTNYFTSENDVKKMYESVLKKFLNDLYEKSEDKINFLVNFFNGHLIEKSENLFIISPELQIRTMRLLNVVLIQKKDYKMTEKNLIKILLALNSEEYVIRECAMKTLETLVENSEGLDENYKSFLKKIVKRREELVMDSDQIGLILFTLLTTNSFKKTILSDFNGYFEDPATPAYISSAILEILKHISNLELFSSSVKVALRIFENEIGGYESKILKLAINRINDETIKTLIRSTESWEFVKKSIKCHTALKNDEAKYLSPSILLMDMIEDHVFDNVPEKYKSEFIKTIVEAATTSLYPGTLSSAGKLFKRINLDSKIILHTFEEMKTISVDKDPNTKNKRKSRHNTAPSPSILSTNEWKCGVTLLELLQNKVVLNNSSLLVPKLFDVMKRCLEFEEQSSVEYVKQMLLSLILQCCLQISPDGTAKRNLIPDTVFKIDLIVQCIRGTQNPQTHHHALLLLAHVAHMVPEQVLHNMMDIFTFVGSSIVRHDDAYSFQIISKIIDNIIPTLIGTDGEAAKDQKQVIPILKVFSDIILDVPEHRRIPLYVKLIQTLNPTKYLWVFLGVLFESDIVKGVKVQSNKKNLQDDSGEFSKRVEVALAISKEFPPIAIVESCTQLITYVHELPMDIDEDNEHQMDIDITDAHIFSIEGHTSKQLRHFKYVILQFINALISSPQVINKIALLSEEESLEMKKYYQSMIIEILQYIPDISKSIEKSSENRSKYWKIMLHNCYDVLENSISLLSSNTLIIVVQGLMKHKMIPIRRKVIELLNNKLQYQKDYFDESNSESMLNLVDPMMEIIQNTIEENISVNANEKTTLIQLALLSLKLLSKTLNDSNPAKFKEILGSLVKLLENHKKIGNANVLASLILCIAELCSNLKAQSISTLSKFIPTVMKIITTHSTGDQSFDLLTSSVIMSLLKIIETLPLFLSPYLEQIIVEVSKIHAKLMKKEKQDAKTTQIATKIKMIWQKMSSAIPARVLIPAIDSSYRQLVATLQLKAIEQVMNLMSESFVNIKSSEFQGIQTELSTFFLSALQFRCDNSGNEKIRQKNIDIAEQHVIRAFVSLILKLSESSFRPLYFKVYDWSIRDSASNDRAITFFCLSSQIAEALKSLFVLFASDLLTNAASLLDQTNIVKVESEEALFFPDSLVKNLTLIKYILKTLNSIFLHDNQNFMNTLRFDTLMQPLVDQLENTIIFDDLEARSSLVACLSQLAVAVGDDVLWKQLNYQILLKTRNNNPQTRLFALDACVEIVKKIGEDFSPLLPETIPFLAELLEDENHSVERGVQKAIQEVEKVTGESLQKYF